MKQLGEQLWTDAARQALDRLELCRYATAFAEAEIRIDQHYLSIHQKRLEKIIDYNRALVWEAEQKTRELEAKLIRQKKAYNRYLNRIKLTERKLIYVERHKKIEEEREHWQEYDHKERERQRRHWQEEISYFGNDRGRIEYSQVCTCGRVFRGFDCDRVILEWTEHRRTEGCYWPYPSQTGKAP